MLYQIANQPGGFKPAKLFSIDRVFRNEAVDATHLAEFHQVEGVVADRNLTLGDLIGFMEVFFAKMGITGLRFKPAYNPYTEPSLEIFSYHEGLKKWVEIGNSGMFRPEMLEPMGLPADVRVHGWGLSLERPTMIRYGISNIRDLLGHKVSSHFAACSARADFDRLLPRRHWTWLRTRLRSASRWSERWRGMGDCCSVIDELQPRMYSTNLRPGSLGALCDRQVVRRVSDPIDSAGPGWQSPAPGHSAPGGRQPSPQHTLANPSAAPERTEARWVTWHLQPTLT